MRAIEHLALLPIEIPFTRNVEGGAEVFHPEALVGLEFDEGITRLPLDLHGEKIIVECLDPALADGPGVRDGDEDPVALGGRDGLEQIVFGLVEGEGVEIEIRIESGKDPRSDRAVEMLVAMIWRSRADGAAAVDPELLEVPVLVRDRGLPEALFHLGPAGEFTAPGEDGFRARRSFPSDPGIFGSEREGTGHRIGPVCDENVHWLLRCPRRLESGLGCFERTRGRKFDVGGAGEGGESEKRVEESHGWSRESVFR